MKNLVVGMVGDASLHRQWLSGASCDFDLFLVYYGDVGERHRDDAMYYDRGKGTKFNILDGIARKHPLVFDAYDAILVPDDDLLMDADTINRFFEIFHQHRLWVAQPAIIGYLSLPNTAPRFGTLLRYVRCVEIMTPCFSRDAFRVCRTTFDRNRTNWGIDWLWYKLLGEPKDKLAIVDDTVAIHTRPCFFGDTYWRNGTNHRIAHLELRKIIAENEINDDMEEVFGTIPLDMRAWHNQPSEEKLFPRCKLLPQIWSSNLQDVVPL